MSDTNIESGERTECSRHSWSSSNPYKDCPHCTKEDQEIKELRTQTQKLKAALEKINGLERIWTGNRAYRGPLAEDCQEIARQVLAEVENG